MKLAAWIVLFLVVPMAASWPLEDSDGDVSLDGQSVPSTGSGVDLYSLAVEETEETLVFTLKTEPWRPVGGSTLDTVNIWIPFQFGEATYAFQVAMLDAPLLNGRPVNVYLYAEYTEESNGRRVAFLPAEGSVDYVTFTVQKDHIRDENGAPLVAGRSLENLHVQSYQLGFLEFSGPFGSVRDSMPDSGVVSLKIEVGPKQSDVLQMVAKDPLRWSNGRASTYAFEVVLFNRDNATVSFDAAQVPDGWTIYVPEPVSAAKTNITVYVTTPDRHIHDGDETFQLIAKTDTESRIELGVHYPEIPMPAGHHPTVYFHAKGGSTPGSPADMIGTPFGNIGANLGDLVMNTMEAYEHSTNRSVPATHATGASIEENFWGWPILLEPRLRTGLNFTDGPSEVIVHTEAPPMEQTGTLVGELIYFDRDGAFISYPSHLDSLVIADFSVPMTLGETVQAEWTNWNLPDTSYQGPVPFGMNLKFYPDALPNQLPVYSDLTPILTGGQMTLPLGEYDDGVTIPLTAEQVDAVEELGEEAPEVQETPFVSFIFILVMVIGFDKVTKRFK